MLFAALFVAALAAARLVYRYDLYDREPWYMLAAAGVAGAAAMALAGGIEDRVIRVVGAGQPSVAEIAFVAAGIEEGARLAIVLAIALLAPRQFNDPMDGLIYGSVVGIGMALEESSALAIALPVEFVRLFGHVVMGGITGFGLGVLRRRRRGPGGGWLLTSASCFGAGVAIHFAWDYTALSRALDAAAEGWAVQASIALLLVSVGLYGGLVRLGSRWSRAVFGGGQA